MPFGHQKTAFPLEAMHANMQCVMRLHRNLQRNSSGDFARIASAAKRIFKQSAATRYYVEEGLPLLVMSRGKYKQFKQLWLEGKPSST